MSRPRSRRRSRTLLIALTGAFGLTLFAVTARDVAGDHALGTEVQTAWREHLLRVADALARNDVEVAQLHWRDAYAAALKARHWDGLVAVGDAYRVIGERGRFRRSAEAKARETYLAALFRARSEGSLEGVLRVAERFAELGDRAVVEQCIRVAQSVASKTKDPRAEERVRAFTERWAARARALEIDPLSFIHQH